MILKILPIRIPLIVDLITEKCVLHYGFANDDLFWDKLQQDTFLHEHLWRQALVCYGIDINEKAVKELRSFYFDTIFTKENRKTTEIEWHYIILGEILEHIPEPVAFLKQIKKLHPKSKILITTPNAFSLKNFINVFRRKESVNSDHYFWFSEKTLLRTLKKANLSGDIKYIESYERGFFTSIFLILFLNIGNKIRNILVKNPLS